LNFEEQKIMGKLDKFGKLFESDVLVIGGGLAGLWAANKATESVRRVLVADKGPVDWGGIGSMAGGDFDAVLPHENPEDFVQDLVYYYDGICDQEVVETIFRYSYERLQDYQRWGCEFLTGENGELIGIPQRSLEHVKLYPAKKKTTGGPDMVRGLINEANRLGVKRLARTLVTDLLKNGNRIAGAVGFNTLTGEYYIFKTRAVVLATGQAGWKNTRATSSGEGIWMALKAGVDVANCEFMQVHNQPKLYEWEGQTKLLPLGAKFVNALGEIFMDKYSPKFGTNTDPNFNVAGMALEARAGRGPFYLDTSPVKEEDLELVKPHSGWQLLNYEKLKELGIDVFKERTEWAPAPIALYAGIIADPNGKTKVPGLYVAGRSRLVDGGVYMGGFALCNTAVTGYLAGQCAAEYARLNSPLPIDGGEVKLREKELLSSIGANGISPKEVLTEIRKAIFPYDVCIIKCETSLKKALEKIHNVKSDLLPKMKAADTHYMMKLIEVRGILFMSECYLKASLMRTESRSGHYREDFPRRDDMNWLKWIVLSMKDSEPEFRTEPIPYERYKFELKGFYTDNFTFSKK
jgi:succinate dehydrogenase/fumarate reductase flavoprotein subunit